VVVHRIRATQVFPLVELPIKLSPGLSLAGIVGLIKRLCSLTSMFPNMHNHIRGKIEIEMISY
jgi:hypothetical protein